MADQEADQGLSQGWQRLLTPALLPSLAVMLGGILLHSMNVMLVATVLPSIVAEVGGAALMSWPTTAFLAASIVAAACTGLLVAVAGAGRTFCGGALVFCAGTLLCALAPSMAQVIAGRVVQGLGGGLLSAVAYVLVRRVFPQALWPRVFALLAAVWSVSVLLGPLLGGLFARYGDWRGAFFAVAVLAGLLAVFGLLALPAAPAKGSGGARAVPGARLALICAAIAALSLAAVVAALAATAGLIVLAVAILVAMLRLDRGAAQPLLPSDAFSPRTPTGLGLWLALLLSITYSPLPVYGPLLLQRLHGLDPLAAGYTVAAAAMAWTLAAMAVAALPGAWSGRMLVAGPLLMAAGLGGLALAMPAGPLAALVPAFALIGSGIGACWAFAAQRAMSGARPGEEDVAASSVATVQQTGFALGAAVAGLIANGVGLSVGLEPEGLLGTARWLPAGFIAAAAAGAVAGWRLSTVSRASG